MTVQEIFEKAVEHMENKIDTPENPYIIDETIKGYVVMAGVAEGYHPTLCIFRKKDIIKAYKRALIIAEDNGEELDDWFKELLFDANIAPNYG